MDALLNAADSALRALFVAPRASRPCPTVPEDSTTALSEPDRALAGALMRVNHVGEVCAQALYASQALAARGSGAQRNESLARQLEAAAGRKRITWPGRRRGWTSWVLARLC